MFEYGIHFLLEAHVEHLIGFVQNKPLYTAEIYFLTPDHVIQAARGSHDDLRAFIQLFDLQLNTRSAINGRNFNSGNELSITSQVLRYLKAEFTRRTEYQGLGFPEFRPDVMQYRQSEGGRFSCSGLGKSYKIGRLLNEGGDNFGLYRHGVFKPEGFNRLN
jgi:hypothetical protein